MSADSLQFGEAVAAAVEARIRAVIAHIAEYPEAAERVADRPGVHVVPVIRYPYKIFYWVLADRIRIYSVGLVQRSADQRLSKLPAGSAGWAPRITGPVSAIMVEGELSEGVGAGARAAGRRAGWLDAAVTTAGCGRVDGVASVPRSSGF